VLGSLIATAEPSRVPFYIAGAVLVGWAVLLSAVGLTRPEFPGSARGARGVMLLSVVLALATIAAAILTDP
jgi:hypothetical protein